MGIPDFQEPPVAADRRVGRGGSGPIPDAVRARPPSRPQLLSRYTLAERTDDDDTDSRSTQRS
jgi:hypothetical protein